MQVGNFHGTLRNKFVCQSISEFDVVYKMKDEAVRMFGEAGDEELGQYEEIIERIFETLQEIKQEHHNTQSKMLLIRNSLSDLE